MQQDVLKALFPSIPSAYLQPHVAISIPYAVGYTPPPNKPFILGITMQKIVLNLPAQRAKDLAAHFNTILPIYGLDQKGIFEEFLPQIAHESGAFRTKEENLNYSWQRLLQIFPKYFKTEAQAKQYGRQPQKIANLVYGGRMGNSAPNDGWDNRGGGYIQLTGKSIYTSYANYKGEPIEAIRVKVRTEEHYAIDSACWYFSIFKSLKDEAERNDFLAITKGINGGTNGYQDRLDYYNRVKLYL